MKITIIGKNGMLGSCVYELIKKTFNIEKDEIIGLSHKEMDITNYQEIENKNINNSDFVINCSAITDTTYCNTNVGMIDSFKVNVIGTFNIGKFCSRNNIHLIHISTDAVYSEYSKINTEMNEFPVNVYGMHKLTGDILLKNLFKDDKYLSILRCSWLFGKTPNKDNFVDKIIKMCKKNNFYNIKVVDDCFGKPMSCEFLSIFILKCIQEKQYGIIDSQPNTKFISRYDFSNIIINTLKKHDQRFSKVIIERCKSDQFKNCINQSKIIYNTTDKNIFYEKIVNSIQYSDDIVYWIKKYIDENINHLIIKNNI